MIRRRALTSCGLLACVTACLVIACAQAFAEDLIFPVAGTGTDGFSSDQSPASRSRLNAPADIAVFGDGSFLVADRENHRIRYVGSRNVIITVAGTGEASFNGDGIDAVAATLNSPQAVARTPDGGFIIADTGNHRVRKVSPGGTISTIAGTGTRGFSGDNGPATSAELSSPTALAVIGEDHYLIADTSNDRIREVLPNGTIRTIAGNGVRDFGGDGWPATDASLNLPGGVAITENDEILVSDTFNNRVRLINKDGKINTVAGVGSPGFAGDGEKATLARLNRPKKLTPLPGGGFLFADQLNGRVRRVSSNNTITTVAGDGGSRAGGDNGPATSATLRYPESVSLTTCGFLIVDSGDHVVRRVVSTCHTMIYPTE